MKCYEESKKQWWPNSKKILSTDGHEYGPNKFKMPIAWCTQTLTRFREVQKLIEAYYYLIAPIGRKKMKKRFKIRFPGWTIFEKTMMIFKKVGDVKLCQHL